MLRKTYLFSCPINHNGKSVVTNERTVMNKLTIQGGGPQFWKELQEWLVAYSNEEVTVVQLITEDAKISKDVNEFTLIAANDRAKKRQQLNNACVLNLKDK